MRLHGKLAIVTGGASGIGFAIAERFAREGAAVAILDIDGTAGKRAAARLRECGGQARAYVADVGDQTAAESVIPRTIDDLGGVDLLVNAAGLPSAYAEGSEWHRWRKGLDQSLSSAYLVTSLVTPHMERRGGGSVLHISSIAAYGASGVAWYGAAKAGLLSLTRSQAAQLGPVGIRVNALCPGIIDTPRTKAMQANPAVMETWLERTPLGRIGRAEEIAEAALFLASDETAGFITGVALAVDGGNTAAGGLYRNPGVRHA
jgi:NAD(P)-dependent dehydrogenase (short-subunit alcohol dehydrogenase family)